MNMRLIVFGFLLGVFLFPSCKRKGCTDPEAVNYWEKAKKDDGSCVYDQRNFLFEVLDDIGNGIILPRYRKMDSLLVELNNAVITFSNDINETNLAVAQNKLKEAEKAWQKCSTFEFGPAEENSLRSHVNTFPTDTVSIEQKISSGSYDLSSFLAVGYKGLPALDYLLFESSNNKLIQKFSSSANRVTFLKGVSEQLHNDVEEVYTLWKSTGNNYIETFVTTDGTDVSSSLSLLVNQFNFDYELLKNAKIGIPLGKQTLGVPYPEQTEAYYSGISAELARESLKGIFNLYHGISESGVDNNGLHDYLIELDNEPLSSDINAQFESAIAALNSVPDPLSETIVSNPTIVDVAYEEIKKLVIYIKTDLCTEMEVSITYSDGDGD